MSPVVQLSKALLRRNDDLNITTALCYRSFSYQKLYYAVTILMDNDCFVLPVIKLSKALLRRNDDLNVTTASCYWPLDLLFVSPYRKLEMCFPQIMRSVIADDLKHLIGSNFDFDLTTLSIYA